MTLDVLVGMQIMHWYPMPDIMEAWKGMRRAVQQFISNKCKNGGNGMVSKEGKGMAEMTIGG